MLEYFPESLVKQGIIMAASTNGGMARVSLSESYSLDSPYDNIRTARIIGTIPQTLPVNKPCLLIKENASPYANLYFLGVLENSVGVANDTTGTSSDEVGHNVPIKSNRGNTKVLLDENKITLKSSDGEFSLSPQRLYGKVAGAEANLENSNAGFMVKNGEQVSGSVVVGQTQLHLFHRSMMKFETGDFIARLTGGNFIITGRRDREEGGSATSEVEHYLSLNRAYFKTRNFDIDTEGGSFVHSGNTHNIHLGSARMTSFIPGTGPTDAYVLDILEGNAIIDTGLGDIKITTYNVEYTNKVKLRCGSMIHPTASNLILEANSAEFSLETVFFAVSTGLYLDKGGKAELNAFKSIDLTTTTGDITLDSMANINLTSMMDTSIDATKKIIMNATMGIETSSDMKIMLESQMDTEIMSQMKIKLESAMDTIITALKAKIEAQLEAIIEAANIKLNASTQLDMSGSTVIKAGPKMAMPTGSGPFCAIPTCLFTGAPHVGDTAM